MIIVLELGSTRSPLIVEEQHRVKRGRGTEVVVGNEWRNLPGSVGGAEKLGGGTEQRDGGIAVHNSICVESIL